MCVSTTPTAVEGEDDLDLFKKLKAQKISDAKTLKKRHKSGENTHPGLMLKREKALLGGLQRFSCILGKLWNWRC